MTKKKMREKVTAVITVAHLSQFALQLGKVMTHDDAVAFLNGDGHAYAMWKRMMQAGEEYIKSALLGECRVPVALCRADSKLASMVV